MNATASRATLENLLARPIAFHRAFARVAGGALPGLFLSQCFYWAQRTRDPQQWFYKTIEEWEAETALTRGEQETARKRLQRLGLLEVERRGLPARLFFRLNLDKLVALIEQTITEITPEISTETTQTLPPTPQRGKVTGTQKSLPLM